MSSNIGHIESIVNEVCLVSGIENIALGNMVEFSSGGRGMVLGFQDELAQAITFGNFHDLKKGDLVRVVSKRMELTINEDLLGRVINPAGQPLDDLNEILEGDKCYIDPPAKRINHRTHITKPLNTGYLIIDSQIPVGLGQRELLVGEKKVGKNDIAVEIICNQTKIKSDIVSIYVAIDAETSSTKRRIRRLKETGALKNSIVVVGRTSESASLNYIAPMTGITIAEWFASKGRDTLVVFDNLTRHAKVYRHLSLLMGQPAGREAYPGDIFYVHARLLERSGAFTKEVGGGSVTALPIVETVSDDVTDYITTNLMSITDGHILFKQTLVNKGIQPAIDSGFSVTRIGSRAQTLLMRDLSDKLKQVIIQFGEVERYMMFGSDLKQDTLEQMKLGQCIEKAFNQPSGRTYDPIEESIILYYLVSKHCLRWTLDQQHSVINKLVAFINQAEYQSILSNLYLSERLEHAKGTLENIFTDFVKDKNTPQPEEKHSLPSASETETLVSLLRSNTGEVAQNKNAAKQPEASAEKEVKHKLHMPNPLKHHTEINPEEVNSKEPKPQPEPKDKDG